MDTITHGIIGALIGKAFFASESPPIRSWREPATTTGRVAICAATLGAVFPDIDTLAGPIAHNSLAIMIWHRGITHSLVLLPVWTMILAVLTRWLGPRLRWPVPRLTILFLIYAIALGSHIFLDLITSFGTMIWNPINYERLAWDWLFIVDLTLTSLALLPQLAAWAFEVSEGARRRAVSLWVAFSIAAFTLLPVTRILEVPYSVTAAVAASAMFAFFFLLPLRRKTAGRLNRTLYSRVGVALVVIYISFAGTMHHIALRHVTGFARQSGINAQEIAALPLPPSPARWAGMIATPGGLYRLEFNEFSGEPVAFRYFPQAPPNRYIVAANELRDVQIFRWFARFPLFQYYELDGKPVVLITAMSFYRSRGRQQRSNDSGMTNFTYRVVFSPEARVVSQGWVRAE
jgi:membrane-bound metal-dependent hydrolase YbcI (DUF457 family)